MEMRLRDQERSRETEAAKGGGTFPSLHSPWPHSDPDSGISAMPHFADGETEARRGFRASQLLSGGGKGDRDPLRDGLPTLPLPQG